MRHFKPERRNHVPKGSVKIVPKDVAAEVYVYEAAGRVYALGFSGKRNRPDFHIRFQSVTRREAHVLEWLARLRSYAERKAQDAAERRGFRHGLKVGDILHYSWGYDQTQCEFYQVTATTPGTITMREVAQQTAPGSTVPHGMADSRLALKGEFLADEEPITKRVQYSAEGPGSVTMKHGCASLWDGRPKYRSWYA
jgi:hypothetical protein